MKYEYQKVKQMHWKVKTIIQPESETLARGWWYFLDSDMREKKRKKTKMQFMT